MNSHQFIKHVQQRAHLESLDEALNATKATLETLGERLFQEAEQLAAQLPADLGNFLRQHDSNIKYDFDEFLQQIGNREGTDPAVAMEHARAVIGVLLEAVSKGEMQDVMDVLPKDYSALFEEQERTLH